LPNNILEEHCCIPYIEEKEEMNLANVFLGQKFYREKKNNNNVTWIYIPGNVY
jgi:hypothetical protein